MPGHVPVADWTLRPTPASVRSVVCGEDGELVVVDQESVGVDERCEAFGELRVECIHAVAKDSQGRRLWTAQLRRSGVSDTDVAAYALALAMRGITPAKGPTK